MQTTVALASAPFTPGSHEYGFEFTEVEIDDPRPDEVLVRVVATGLCHTDLTVPAMLPAEMFPTVMGHEGTGVVEAVGSEVRGIEVGDHVVMSFRSCRACGPCRAGDVGYCEQALLLNYMGMRADGSTTMRRGEEPVFGSFFGQSSFARHALAYADNCVVVPQDLDLALLAPFGCGFQTGAGTVLNVLRPAPEESLVVFGAGAVGLAAIAAARGAGVGTVIAVDPVAARRRLAEGYGATVLEPGSEVAERVKELTGGGASYAIDTTALAPVVQQAQHALRSRGTLVALGLGAPEYPIDAIDLLQSGKIVRSSVEGDADPLQMVPELIRRRAAGTFDVDQLVTTYPFERIADAIADTTAGKVVKAVLTW
ncbi:NAD(P)-dependent alcohol dehydrogenase [Nocardioides bizhenqiangii]|uniref:NAD(P)-dependent alcohol dehydrogenase n=1 Tax=Nocardioides bizhenqiangii TaxID=3095076 RepID=A0ABZ0ZMT9_9ACTN|nr:NAD(P)-dependent alcohol dehydrogenase [Nocardioides sp. HM61]WQQ25094.1 NAD(P)-dependent alcohol dehydrogenase [Nocardioides sp. HM61]